MRYAHSSLFGKKRTSDKALHFIVFLQLNAQFLLEMLGKFVRATAGRKDLFQGRLCPIRGRRGNL